MNTRSTAPILSKMATPRTVKCPQCGTSVDWSPTSRWRPFCSERCKMIDLGAWASDGYRIETPEAPESSEKPPRDDG